MQCVRMRRAPRFFDAGKVAVGEVGQARRIAAADRGGQLLQVVRRIGEEHCNQFGKHSRLLLVLQIDQLRDAAPVDQRNLVGRICVC